MPKRVLIAEDDPSSLMLLQLMLEGDGGFEIVTAMDGEAAWKILEAGPAFDVCLLDIMMPELDGLGLIKRIRAHPRLFEQPVILCTALNDRSTVAQAVELAVSHYIVKPYSRDRILKEIKLACPEAPVSVKLEPFANTAARLGIKEQQVSKLLGGLVKQTTDLVGTLQAGQAEGAVPAAIRVNGLKGAAINFGAFGLYQALTAIEEHLGQGAPNASAAAIHEVELENKRLSDALAVAAAAEIPVAPAAVAPA